jgi:hypothetical protein
VPRALVQRDVLWNKVGGERTKSGANEMGGDSPTKASAVSQHWTRNWIDESFSSSADGIKDAFPLTSEPEAAESRFNTFEAVFCPPFVLAHQDTPYKKAKAIMNHTLFHRETMRHFNNWSRRIDSQSIERGTWIVCKHRSVFCISPPACTVKKR